MNEAINVNGKIEEKSTGAFMDDWELEQMIIQIVKCQLQENNDVLLKRLYGSISKELAVLKNNLVKEFKK